MKILSNIIENLLNNLKIMDKILIGYKEEY
jgi:hypothetical protein